MTKTAPNPHTNTRARERTNERTCAWLTHVYVQEARDLVRILIESINYLHVRNIVHRDLKPENLLLANAYDDSDIRLADFGFAKKVNRPLSTQCGTPGYVAPEIIKGEKYGLGVDMWSIGVITYILLGGYPPFHDDNQAVLYKKIKAGDFVFHAEYWDPVSDEAKQLICSMLTVDIDKRMTSEQALKHPWLCGMTDEELGKHDLHGTLDEIKKFNARRKLKGTIKAVMAANKIKILLRGLAKASKAIKKEAAEEEAAEKGETVEDEKEEKVKVEDKKEEEVKVEEVKEGEAVTAAN